MRKSTTDAERQGFTLNQRRSSRYPKEVLCDLDFADDICLCSDDQRNGQELLRNVERHAGSVGLRLNESKTEYLTININDKIDIKTRSSVQLNEVDNYKYLGALVRDSKGEITKRIGMAWSACNNMNAVWKSGLNKKTKLSIFKSNVESIIMYGSDTWTVTRELEEKLDGCYTKLMRKRFNVHWSQHMTDTELYGKEPKLSTKIQQHRLRLAGHSYRSTKEPVSQLITWSPKHGRRNRGRQRLSYTDVVARDIGVLPADLPN